MGRGGGSKSAVLDYLSEGTFESYRNRLTAQTFTIGTEFEVLSIAANITANAENRDMLFPWIRAKVYVYDSTPGHSMFEWFLVRCPAADGLQDLSDIDVMDALLKEKKILARGVVSQPGASYAPLKPIAFELYRIRLKEDDELRLICYPWTNNAATLVVDSILEYRVLR